MWVSFLRVGIGFGSCQYGIKMNLQKLDDWLRLPIHYTEHSVTFTFCPNKVVLMMHNDAQLQHGTTCPHIPVVNVTAALLLV